MGTSGRKTKKDFDLVVDKISNTVGQRLYLVSGYRRMYLSNTPDNVECQGNYLLCMSDAYSNANYENLCYFLRGLEVGRTL